jgi:hypothetical protein
MWNALKSNFQTFQISDFRISDGHIVTSRQAFQSLKHSELWNTSGSKRFE